jgi:hypothetical protein
MQVRSGGVAIMGRSGGLLERPVGTQSKVCVAVLSGILTTPVLRWCVGLGRRVCGGWGGWTTGTVAILRHRRGVGESTAHVHIHGHCHGLGLRY